MSCEHELPYSVGVQSTLRQEVIKIEERERWCKERGVEKNKVEYIK